MKFEGNLAAISCSLTNHIEARSCHSVIMVVVLGVLEVLLYLLSANFVLMSYRSVNHQQNGLVPFSPALKYNQGSNSIEVSFAFQLAAVDKTSVNNIGFR